MLVIYRTYDTNQNKTNLVFDEVELDITKNENGPVYNGITALTIYCVKTSTESLDILKKLIGSEKETWVLVYEMPDDGHAASYRIMKDWKTKEFNIGSTRFQPICAMRDGSSFDANVSL